MTSADRSAVDTDRQPIEDDEIRTLVRRLARRHPSGGTVIERAAILAEGGDFAAVMEWIIDRGGIAEDVPAARAQGGLHSTGPSRNGQTGREAAPRRFVLPPDALS
jgi:hypothetical protein